MADELWIQNHYWNNSNDISQHMKRKMYTTYYSGVIIFDGGDMNVSIAYNFQARNNILLISIFSAAFKWYFYGEEYLRYARWRILFSQYE